jgi:hypothetical protein
MKKVLKIVFMLFCFVVGLLLATFYKELVGLTGNVGFVIATLGAVVALLSAIILLVGTFHALKHRVMIR